MTVYFNIPQKCIKAHQFIGLAKTSQKDKKFCLQVRAQPGEHRVKKQ